MKISISNMLRLACLCIPFPGMSQLNYFQHPLPPGVTTSTGRPSTIAVDPSGNKWITFATAGLGMYDGFNWTMFNTQNSGLPSDSTTCTDFDASGNLWVGTKLGAAYKSGTNWSIYNTGNSGLPSNIIRAVHIDGNTIWFGTYNGLVSFDGSIWTTYNTSNSGIVNDSIMVIRKDISNTLWIGTRNGLSGFKNNVWTNFTVLNSAIYRLIYDIECNTDGKIWLSSGNPSGLSNINGNKINYIENNQVKVFEDDLYFYERDFTYRPSDIALNDLGEVFFQIYGNGISYFKISSTEQTTLLSPGINYGNTSTGCRLVFDQTGTLWAMARSGYNLYSLDVINVPPSNYNWLNNYREIDINDVAAGINASGDMHWDYTNPKYEVPKGSGKHSVFASAFWIGGLDQAGNLHQAGQTYRQTGVDYWPGPIAGMSIPFDSTSSYAFDKVWKVDKLTIEEFKTEFLAGNVSNGNYPVPDEILTWPAKGNGIVTDHIAPFVDYNGDGIYDPFDGDYPLIKGDQMLFNVFNDSLYIHSATGGASLGIEVRSSAYAYQCAGIPDSLNVLNRTTLYHYEIINRSSNNYFNVFMGLWSDMDLGNAVDDVVGCDSSRAAGFTYNDDNDDETSAGYGLNPPMQNIKILKGPLADPVDAMDNDLDGFVDEPGERCTMNHFMYYNNVNGTPTGNPNSGYDYYYYLQSIWPDGQHLTYGGDGRDTNNAYSNFMFSGVPFSGIGWTQSSFGGFPDDRRLIMGSGPISLLAGDTTTIEFAYIFSRDSINPNGLTTSIAKNQMDLDRVQNWYENNNFPSCLVLSADNSLVVHEKLTVFPNPATTQLTIRNKSQNFHGNRYTILNSLGAEVQHGLIKANTINIQNLTTNFYILKLEIDGEITCVKFMKQ